MSTATTYRTCPRSGLQFESQAEKLMLANAVAAVVFLLIGGILAIGVVLSGSGFDGTEGVKALKIEGGKAHVTFDYPGAGLMVAKKEGRNPATEAKEEKLKRFAVAGEDKKWFWADAVIEGNAVVVSSPDVKAPVAVRYAFEMNPDGANLYNREGLPASPFRTDSW